MANKEIRTNVVVSAEAKGFEPSGQKISKFNDQVEKGIAAQAKGYEEVAKGGAAAEKLIAKLKKTFGDSSKEMAKHIDAVTKEFRAIDKADFKDVRKQIDGLNGNLSELAKEQAAVTSAMASMEDKTGPAYQKLEEHLKGVREESTAATQQINLLTKSIQNQVKAAEDAHRKRQAFVQGMAQGGFQLPAIGLQRGPNMGRQAAGMAVGMGLRGLGRGAGMGGAMFGGVGGMSQAISGIPYVGPALAGQFSMAAGFAQQAIQAQQVRLGAIPQFMGADEIQRRGAARARAVAQNKGYQQAVESRKAAEGDVAVIRKRIGYLEEREQLLERIQGGETVSGAEVQASIEREILTREGANKVLGRDLRPLSRADIRGTSPEMLRLQKKLLQERMFDAMAVTDKAEEAELKAELAVQKAPGKRMRDPFRQVRRQGRRLAGVSEPEAIQMAAALAQTGGGLIPEAQQQGLVGAAFAAKTRFGIGMETSGSFLQAGRRGGMVGARGQAGQAFQNTLAEGLKLGLEGSELNTWMQQAAQGIQQFQQTGIEINTQSISNMAGEISRSGITGTRAAAISRGFQGGLQQIGTRGVQSGMDLMLLQMFGGYEGGGIGGYRKSREQLETMTMQLRGQGAAGIAQSGFGDQFRKIMGIAGSDPAAQAEFLQRTLQELGANVSTKESTLLAQYFQGRETPEQLNLIKAEQERQSRTESDMKTVMTPGGLEAQAAGIVGTTGWSVKAQASITNRQISAGREMVSIVQSLERSSTNVNQAFRTLSGDTLKSFTSGIEQASLKAIELLIAYLNRV